MGLFPNSRKGENKIWTATTEERCSSGFRVSLGCLWGIESDDISRVLRDNPWWLSSAENLKIIRFDMEVSINGTTKWIVYNGKSYWNRWFEGTCTLILGNLHIILYHKLTKTLSSEVTIQHDQILPTLTWNPQRLLATGKRWKKWQKQNNPKLTSFIYRDIDWGVVPDTFLLPNAPFVFPYHSHSIAWKKRVACRVGPKTSVTEAGALPCIWETWSWQATILGSPAEPVLVSQNLWNKNQGPFRVKNGKTMENLPNCHMNGEDEAWKTIILSTDKDHHCAWKARKFGTYPDCECLPGGSNLRWLRRWLAAARVRRWKMNQPNWGKVSPRLGKNVCHLKMFIPSMISQSSLLNHLYIYIYIMLYPSDRYQRSALLCYTMAVVRILGESRSFSAISGSEIPLPFFQKSWIFHHV